MEEVVLGEEEEEEDVGSSGEEEDEGSLGRKDELMSPMPTKKSSEVFEQSVERGQRSREGEERRLSKMKLTRDDLDEIPTSFPNIRPIIDDHDHARVDREETSYAFRCQTCCSYRDW